MKVIGKLILQKFWQEYKRARNPLERWIQITEKTEWHNFAQIKQTFGRCSEVKANNRRFVVFDISGNKYRLVTTINYRGQIVIITAMLTHQDYDQEKWKV